MRAAGPARCAPADDARGARALPPPPRLLETQSVEVLPSYVPANSSPARICTVSNPFLMGIRVSQSILSGRAQEKDDMIAELKRKLLAAKPRQLAMAGGMSLEESVMAGAPPRSCDQI